MEASKDFSNRDDAIVMNFTQVFKSTHIRLGGLPSFCLTTSKYIVKFEFDFQNIWHMQWFDVFRNISTVWFLLGKFLKPPSPRIQQLSTELWTNEFITWQAFCEPLLRHWSCEMNRESTLKELTVII